MRFSTIALLSMVSGVFAGNCGPDNGNQKCAQNECCKNFPPTTIDRVQISAFMKTMSIHLIPFCRQPIWMVWHYR
jgi:hypothetical protein